ncbi:hypothetical protein EV2_021195 [Malus domestica]
MKLRASKPHPIAIPRKSCFLFGSKAARDAPPCLATSWRSVIGVNANLFFLTLGQNCTYKTNNTLGQGQEPHAHMMNEGLWLKNFRCQS